MTREVTVRFVIPTDYIGVEFDEEMTFYFEDDEDEEERTEEIQNELCFWLDDQLDTLRGDAYFEIVSEEMEG